MWVFWLGNKIQDFKVKYLGKEIRVPSSKASKGERAVSAALDRLGYNYTMQYPFGYMHVDFCVKANDKLYFIEYDGQQHFRPVPYFGGRKAFFFQRLRDIVEGWECKDRGIPLLRIKYDKSFEQFETIIDSFIKGN